MADLTESYQPSRPLIGETPVKIDVLATYYGDGSDELHMAFNFPFLTAPFDADSLRRIVEDTEALLPAGAWPAWTGSNHDMSRFASRWADDDPRKIRTALVMLLCLRGTPVLYQGDEIGLGDRAVAHELMRDPLGVRYFPAYAGRDAMRTPMPWRNAPGAGFTAGQAQPWLPVGDTESANVEDQRSDPRSVLALVRDIIALRRHSPELQTGSYASMEAPAGAWVWRRGTGTVIALNMSEADATISGAGGRISISTDRERDGELLSDPWVLRPWEAAIVESP
jgi:alpha-glucosidase